VTDWTGVKGFQEWGQSLGGFYGISTDENYLEWKWNGATVQRETPVVLPDCLKFLPLPNERYLAIARPDTDKAAWPLVLAHLTTKDAIKKWEPPNSWGYDQTGGSRGGKYVVVTLTEESTKPPLDYDWKNPRLRVGLMDIASADLRWVFEHRGEIHGGISKKVTASEDGKYIAITGWNHGVALIDTSKKSIKWTKLPSGAVSFSYAVFSSNGELLYAADSGGGCVYAFDTRTGTILRQWYATVTGRSIYGHRISCLALSPDDAWIAAGTGPEGQVFLFSTASSEGKPILFPHGMSTTLIVSFSPDSKHLASVAYGKIKLWAVK
jgi:WD40 repeat protein